MSALDIWVLVGALDNIVRIQQQVQKWTQEGKTFGTNGIPSLGYFQSRIVYYWKEARTIVHEDEAEIEIATGLRLIPKNEAAERILALYEECCVERALLAS